MMMHKKIALIAVYVAVFICVSGIGWALVYSQSGNENALPEQINDETDNEFLTPEQIRDTIICYIKSNHAETEQFMNDLVWTGGREDTGLLGAEIYTYASLGWTVKISYPVIANPSYAVTAHYSVPPGEISIPYSVTWEGTWENGAITEANYIFVQ